MNDLHDLLARVQAGQQLAAHGALAHARHELLDHLEIDVRLEQCEADLAQRAVEVGFGDLCLATKALGQRLEARGQGFEHGWTDTGNQRRRRIADARRLPILGAVDPGGNAVTYASSQST